MQDDRETRGPGTTVSGFEFWSLSSRTSAKSQHCPVAYFPQLYFKGEYH